MSDIFVSFLALYIGVFSFMCLPEPGPRCSYHAYKKYVAAVSMHSQAVTNASKEYYKSLMDDRRKIYESTPKGQNELKREIMFAESDAAKLAASEKLQAGQALREKQMHDYMLVEIRRDRMFKGDESASGFSRKLETAAVAMYSFAEGFADETSEVVNETCLQTKIGKFFVMGAKATVPLFTHKNGTNDSLEGIVDRLPANFWSDVNIPEKSELLSIWFSDLQAKGFVGVSVVNLNTSDVAFLDFDDADKILSAQFKLKQKLSGTTKWVRGKKLVMQTFSSLEGFEDAVFTEDSSGVVVKGTGYIMKALRTQGDMFLSENKGPDGEIFYVVRRRHNPSSVTVNARLKPRTLAFTANISDSLREEAEAGLVLEGLPAENDNPSNTD